MPRLLRPVCRSRYPLTGRRTRHTGSIPALNSNRFQPFGACPMLYDNRSPAVLLAIAVLIASSCLAAEDKKSEKKGAGSKAAAERSPALLDPSLAKDKAPDKFKAKFTTT